MEWLNLTEILLQLGACITCYYWGKTSGVSGVISLLLEKKIITEKDLEKLSD